MKTATTDPEAMTAADLDAEYRRAAYAVSQGDNLAAIRLAKIEERIDANVRAERREAAATAEAERLTIETAKQAEIGARQAEEAAYQSALICKIASFSLVEQVVEELIPATQAAIIAGNAAHAAALRLGYRPGILASSQISTYIAWKLGRDGADTAGLSDMAPVFPVLRVPLVQPTTD